MEVAPCPVSRVGVSPSREAAEAPHKKPSLASEQWAGSSFGGCDEVLPGSVDDLGDGATCGAGASPGPSGL
eukprot:1511927-Pyramimonas_sp.AAC.1